jgi:radical SAM protein with 4Fe4S-binding SPASM domain
MAEATKPKVNSVAIELTAHCNQKCDYCYNDWREDNGAELVGSGGDKLLARVRKILDAWEVDHFTLSGGEPFSTPDVWPLLELLQERGVASQIISNGGLITDAIAARLALFSPRYVQVTLNGANAELHEEHVGEGHFARTLAGVEALKRHGVTVVGCVVVTKKNSLALGEILALWHSLGVKHIALSRFSPAGYAVSYAAQLLPSRADLMTAFEQAVPYAREQDMRISCTMPVPPCVIETQDYQPLEFGYCPIGTSMQELALGPDGKLRNCTLHKTAIGGVNDILDPAVDLAELLQAPEITDYQRKLPEFCDGCVHASSCAGGCGAASEWVLGQHERRKPDPFLWQHVDDDFGARLERERADGRRRLEVIL